MTELADLELSGRLPSLVVKEVELFLDFGYYIDERGYKRYGVIPKLQPLNIEYKINNYDNYRIETSDPRLLY